MECLETRVDMEIVTRKRRRIEHEQEEKGRISMVKRMELESI